MTTDDLDQKSDRELDELFAVECAGWSKREGQGEWCWLMGGTTSVFRTGVPHFTKSPEDVLHWLEKQPTDEWHHTMKRAHPWHTPPDGYRREVHVCYVRNQRIWTGLHEADATTCSFARAACIALLRAKRNEKLA